MQVTFYIDEQVPDAITEGLRRRGVDVLRVQDDGHRGADDEVVLDRAGELGRVVFSQDDDFLVIAVGRQRAGGSFAGVVYVHQLHLPVGKCIEDLATIAGAESMDEYRDRIRYLPIR